MEDPHDPDISPEGEEAGIRPPEQRDKEPSVLNSSVQLDIKETLPQLIKTKHDVECVTSSQFDSSNTDREIHGDGDGTHPQDYLSDEDEVLFDVKNNGFQGKPECSNEETDSQLVNGVHNNTAQVIHMKEVSEEEQLEGTSQDDIALATLDNSHKGVNLDVVHQMSTESVVDGKEHKLKGEIDDGGEDLFVRVELLERENKEFATQLVTEKNKEASLQEIAKELEAKCFKQQEKIESLELEQRREIEKAQQVAKQYNDASREKAIVIEKLTDLQEERRKLIDQVTDKEKSERELSKENDKLEVLVKKQRAEVLKLQGNLEKNEGRCNQLTQELAKEKEEVNSLNIKVKWAQNKLKAEIEAHKNVKSQLETTTKKLNQSREEGEQIRTSMKEMIQQYQESEDMRSNSLGIKLKKMEKELKQQEQEIADQQELHELTVKELELAKTSHKISQEEVHQHKQKISEMTSRASEFIAEIEELKGKLTAQKQEKKKQTAELSELEQRTNTFEKERIKFSQLREVFTQLQKSHQHLEKELEKRKERESELLAFSAKLSSSNAELTAERSDLSTKVVNLSSELDTLTGSLTESHETREQLQENIKKQHEIHQSEIAELLDKFDGKNKAVEQLSIALEDERENVKAVRKKNVNTIKDLQRQLQSSKRRIENLEASIASENEPPATLPISRASSHSSLNGGVAMTSSMAATTLHPPHVMHDTGGLSGVPGSNENQMTGTAATIPLSSDDDRGGTTPSPEYTFHNMDQEKILLVEKLCQMKKEQVKQEEKVEFYEEHIAQLTEDIQKKSRIIQNFIMREQTGVLTPPSFDENRQRQAKKGGVMGSVFSGKNSRTNSMMPEVNLELSLEMNRKMQSVLEDILLKNITLKENIDTLGKEIQRISAQLQTHEKKICI